MRARRPHQPLLGLGVTALAVFGRGWWWWSCDCDAQVLEEQPCVDYQDNLAQFNAALADWREPDCYTFRYTFFSSPIPQDPVTRIVVNGQPHASSAVDDSIFQSLQDFWNLILEQCIANCPNPDPPTAAAHRCVNRFSEKHGTVYPTSVYVDPRRFIADDEWVATIDEFHLVDCVTGAVIPDAPATSEPIEESTVCFDYEVSRSKWNEAFRTWTTIDPPCYQYTVTKVGESPVSVVVEHSQVVQGTEPFNLLMQQFFELIQERCFADCPEGNDQSAFTCDVTYSRTTGHPVSIFIDNDGSLEGDEDFLIITNFQTRECPPTPTPTVSEFTSTPTLIPTAVGSDGDGEEPTSSPVTNNGGGGGQGPGFSDAPSAVPSSVPSGAPSDIPSMIPSQDILLPGQGSDVPSAIPTVSLQPSISFLPTTATSSPVGQVVPPTESPSALQELEEEPTQSPSQLPGDTTPLVLNNFAIEITVIETAGDDNGGSVDQNLIRSVLAEYLTVTMKQTLPTLRRVDLTEITTNSRRRVQISGTVLMLEYEVVAIFDGLAAPSRSEVLEQQGSALEDTTRIEPVLTNRLDKEVSVEAIQVKAAPTPSPALQPTSAAMMATTITLWPGMSIQGMTTTTFVYHGLASVMPTVTIAGSVFLSVLLW